MPEVMTEEDAERKAAMIRSATEVADAVDELKKNLENKGWSQAEMAALTLFNTMLQTSFAESMKDRHKEAHKKVEDIQERIKIKSIELAKERGFGTGEAVDPATDVLRTCIQMIMEGREIQAGAVFEDFFGMGTKGVLHSIALKARDDIAKEVHDEELS
jgi:hypothetical protein